MTENDNKRIVDDPDLTQGKPYVRGTRIPVEVLLEKLVDGATEQDLLKAYPKLQEQDIQAVLEYAAEVDEDLLKE